MWICQFSPSLLEITLLYIHNFLNIPHFFEWYACTEQKNIYLSLIKLLLFAIPDPYNLAHQAPLHNVNIN